MEKKIIKVMPLYFLFCFQLNTEKVIHLNVLINDLTWLEALQHAVKTKVIL